MASERFVLKHFYYGQFVRDGQPVGDLRLLAQSHGLTEEAIAEVLQLGFIPPILGRDNGSWAIIRGKKAAPFILVEAEIGQAGQRILHFILLNSELVRKLGGNLRLLDPFIDGEMPEYDRVGNEVKPLVLSDVQPPDEEQETDDILSFMMSCRSRMNVMESLLAAVVQGVPLVIINAPDSPEDRKVFIMGLLALLPPSVRFAVTFATHTLPSTKIDVQVRFLSDSEMFPDDAVIYDWKATKVSGRKVDDEYSGFIISQLRLDMDLVIQQTRRLTSIASWRVKQGDKLSVALGYASQRMTVDDAVSSGQPIEAAKVARILADDPTLSDDLRIAYSRHLMSFSMALGELEYAEPLGLMLGANPELSDTAYEMLQQALLKGGAGDIFDLMTKWLQNPLGPRGLRWIRFTHECVKIYLNDIMDDGDFEEVILLLQDVDNAGTDIAAEEIMPQLLKDAEQFALMDTNTAQMVFTMGCKYVDVDFLDTQLSKSSYATHMPEALQFLMKVLLSNRKTEKTGLIMSAAAGFDKMQRLIMVRLVELTLKYQRLDLLDEPVLKQLVKVVRSDWGRPYFPMLYRLTELLSDEKILQVRNVKDSEANTLVLGLLLGMGYYSELAQRMLDQSRILYRGDAEKDYILMIQKLFASTPLLPEEVPHALSGISEAGIRSLPLAMAYIGILDNQTPSEVTDAVAGDVTEIIDQNTGILEVMPLEAMTSLLQYQVKQQNSAMSVHIAYYLPTVAARYGERTVTVMGKAYRILDWDNDVQMARMEMLRLYMRQLDRRGAYRALEGFGMLLGDRVRSQLEATYTLKVLMQDYDIVTYAKVAHRLADLLQDALEAYSGSSVPTSGGIHNDLDSMPGNLTSDDKRLIATEIVKMGRVILQLGGLQSRVRGGNDNRRIEALLKGRENPHTALEVMRVVGGYLSQGMLYPLKLETLQNPHPLGNRNASGFLEDIQMAQESLQSANDCMGKANANVSGQAIYDEMESLWQAVPSSIQRDIVKDFAIDMQRLADLIPQIASSGDARALENSGLGRKLAENKSRPRNVLEFYRFVAGYYLLRS